MRLFEGYAGAHGTHGATSRSDAKGGKLEIKKSAKTVREPVTEAVWLEHLSGSRALGIIPIREDSQCVWGCIDVDKYDVDLTGTVVKLRKMNLPLVVCRSKSGGAHLFLFLSSPVPAEEIRATLRQIAASLGWGDCEVFPKQNQILSDRGDLGNWLNMPYLGGDKTERYAIKETMGGMTLGEFLSYAESRRTTLDKVVPPAVKGGSRDVSLEDGPPCLQHLAAIGIGPGSQNNGLFALGTFCKKAFGEKWKEKLEEYNREILKPPAPSEDVTDIISRLDKKDYQYRCKDQPIVSYCNATLCRQRRFGVSGGSGKWPTISGMSKLMTDPPLWFVDLGDDRVELTTDELQDYRRFQKVCMERLSVTFMPVKANDWTAMVSEAMEDVLPIEAPREVSTLGHFTELLEEFLTNRHRGLIINDVLMGKPWQDPEDGKHYFRLKDLMSHLDKENFRLWGRNTVAQRVTEMGGKHFFNIQGTGVNVFFVRPDGLSAPPQTPLPPSNQDPI